MRANGAPGLLTALLPLRKQPALVEGIGVEVARLLFRLAPTAGSLKRIRRRSPDLTLISRLYLIPASRKMKYQRPGLVEIDR